MAPLSPGLQLAGRYTLERRLGSGGMSQVWSAFDVESRESVAIKALDARLAAHPGMVELLRHEYDQVRRLDHPHIVRALGLHTDSDPPFIVFELADGGDLSRYVGRPPVEFLPLLLPIVDALAQAHAQGVVHRDLKLSNVLVDATGRARLTDFGIAAARIGEGLSLRTGGTPSVMSPQQLARETPAPADDLYALGAMLYELTTGAPAFPPDAPPERIASEHPAPIASRAGVPAQLTQLIDGLLAKERADRPASMEEVATRLRAALAEAVTTVPPELSELQGPGTARFEQVAVVSPRLGRSLERRQERVAPTRAAAWRVRLKLVAGAALVLLAAALVFIYLPRSLPPDTETAAQKPAPAVKPPPASLEVPGPAPFELAKLARARDEAKELVDRLVDLQHEAEAKDALEWAAADYAAATERAQAGDTMFKSQDYDGARKAYQDAEQGLEAVLARAPSVLADALKTGWAAYDANDAATAITQFQLAAKIDPQNADAQRGLRRAQALDQVRALLASAAAAERDGDANKALGNYREASALDPEVAVARDGIQRTTAQIGRTQFDEAMSQGFTALDRGDANAARAAFTRARTLDPSSNAASDALAQVETRVRVGQFEQRQTDAAAAEAKEQWAEAASIYDQVLTVDPTLVFAQKGAMHARQMAKLYQDIDDQLAAPERLASESVYANAQALVKAAAALPGDELARKRTALEQALQASRTPVHVTLESDNITNVVLHQVDQLGRFTVRELDLRPGTYTAVGTREGYRDVRRSFTVVAGQAPQPVVIRCEEKI
jgi:tetratricopeptide (TPR) repeat protein